MPLPGRLVAITWIAASLMNVESSIAQDDAPPASSTAAPAAAESWAGRDVVLRIPEVELKLGKRTTGTGAVERIYRVGKQQGNWLWLVADDVAGWVKIEEVRTVEKALLEIKALIAHGLVADRLMEPERIRYAAILAERGEPGKALAELNDVLRRRPTTQGQFAELFQGSTGAMPYVARARVLARLGRYDEAASDLQQAMYLDKGDPIPVYEAARIAATRGEFRGAYMLATRAAAIDPRQPAARFLKASLGLALGDQGAAEEARAYILLTGWDTRLSPYAAVIRAEALRRVGDADEATKMIEVAREKVKTKAWPRPLLDWMAGELSESALLATATNDEERSEARAYLGLECERQGREAEAAEHWTWAMDRGSPDCLPHSLAKAGLERIGLGGVVVDPNLGSPPPAPPDAQPPARP